MSFESMLSEGAQRMGDLLVDIIEGLGQKVGAAAKALGGMVAGRGDSTPSHSSGATPMIDGERTRAPDTPGKAVSAPSVGQEQKIEISSKQVDDFARVSAMLPDHIKMMVNPVAMNLAAAPTKTPDVMQSMQTHLATDMATPGNAHSGRAPQLAQQAQIGGR